MDAKVGKTYEFYNVVSGSRTMFMRVTVTSIVNSIIHFDIDFRLNCLPERSDYMSKGMWEFLVGKKSIVVVEAL